jgi:inositol-polyphosphate multikinase
VSIVLENIAGGFAKPNILDIKLGARLWDESAKPEKRARLDKVAAGTTSHSLGFRIAGMRVWQGEKSGSGGKGVVERKTVIGGKEKEGLVEFEEETKYQVYNKLYGREFSAENVLEGFEEFVLVPSAGITKEKARKVVAEFLAAVKDIQAIFEGLESRMVSASILLVYEGDPEAFDVAAAHVPKSAPPGQTGDAEEDEDEDEEEPAPKIAAIKMIDFAHAKWTPGEGPDENSLQGMRSTVELLEQLNAKLQG